jgi:hypothetical protein
MMAFQSTDGELCNDEAYHRSNCITNNTSLCEGAFFLYTTQNVTMSTDKEIKGKIIHDLMTLMWVQRERERVGNNGGVNSLFTQSLMEKWSANRKEKEAGFVKAVSQCKTDKLEI